MRRAFVLLSALSLLGAGVGCHLTTGVCDCDTRTGVPSCYLYYGAGVHAEHVPPVAAAAKPEVIKEMPKETPKEKEPKEDEQ
jgi:hypothetical protein